MARFRVVLAYDDQHGRPQARTLTARARTPMDAADLVCGQLGAVSRQTDDRDPVVGVWRAHRVGWRARHQREHRHGLLTTHRPDTAVPAVLTTR